MAAEARDSVDTPGASSFRDNPGHQRVIFKVEAVPQTPHGVMTTGIRGELGSAMTLHRKHSGMPRMRRETTPSSTMEKEIVAQQRNAETWP